MGKIILIGGKMDTGIPDVKNKKSAGIKNIHPQILERFLKEMKGKKSKIEIITAATNSPKKSGAEYKKALKRLGCKKIGVMNFKTPLQADKKKMLKRLSECDGLMFTGGDQMLICKALLKSKFLDVMKKRFKAEDDFLVAGTSAGAMVMSETMIEGGLPSEALKKGRVRLGDGLNLLSNIIIDTHFVNRERFGRLIEAVSTHPEKLGIGLGEDTAVFFRKTHHVETIGTNMVVLIDGSKLTYNNINKINTNEPIGVEDMKLHVLPKGHMFNIPKRRIYKKLYGNKKRSLN
jgi:cyanophycinase